MPIGQRGGGSDEGGEGIYLGLYQSYNPTTEYFFSPCIHIRDIESKILIGLLGAQPLGQSRRLQVELPTVIGSPTRIPWNVRRIVHQRKDRKVGGSRLLSSER